MIQRFVDYIPLAIEHELNQNLSDNIRNTLIQTLFEDSHNGRIDLADLLNEDPATARRRIDLESRTNRLRKIMDELDRFEHLELLEVQDIEVNSMNGDLALGESPGAFFHEPVSEALEVHHASLSEGLFDAGIIPPMPEQDDSIPPPSTKKKKIKKGMR